MFCQQQLGISGMSIASHKTITKTLAALSLIFYTLPCLIFDFLALSSTLSILSLLGSGENASLLTLKTSQLGSIHRRGTLLATSSRNVNEFFLLLLLCSILHDISSILRLPLLHFVISMHWTLPFVFRLLHASNIIVLLYTVRLLTQG